MDFYFKRIALLLKRLLAGLLLFFAARLFFWIYNIGYFAPAWPGEVLNSFIYGVQFDISALIYFNLPFIILHLIPGRYGNSATNDRILKVYFILVNSILLATNLIDAEYFRYTGKRTTSDIFYWIGMNNDAFNLLPRYIYDYWYIMALWAILVSALWWLYPGLKSGNGGNKAYSPRSIILQTFSMVLVSAFLVSLARGYRLKPLRVITATNYVSSANLPLILNTPFTIMKSFNKQHLVFREYFTEYEAGKIFNPVHNMMPSPERESPNVVVIIMESFSREFSAYLNGTKTGYMPFLDSLMQEALVFPNAFANAMKSLEAKPAIVASIPALTETPFITSPYSANLINSMPDQLSIAGYHTSFFHGGINGTMGFDDFAKLAGIENYYGKDQFNDDSLFDGYWGIYDEHFFRFFADKLNTFPQPFFSCFFSLSSHHPYVIPYEHSGRFPAGDKPIHEAVAYADYSLRKFFERARMEDWYNNTLFVITADHSYQSAHPWYRNRVGSYAIPMVYYHPANKALRGADQRLTQHIDIMPSVLDYTGTGGNFVSFGRSVFSDDCRPFVINYLNHHYKLMEEEWVLFHDGDRPAGLFNFKSDSLLLRNLYNKGYEALKGTPVNHLENRLKSMLQQYNDRMLNNRFSTIDRVHEGQRAGYPGGI